ncbi:MAG: hypothetical protein WA441_00735 [Methyloceanibacter sp.]
MLIGISSPYRRAGLLHAKFKGHFGTDDADVLVVRGATAAFNPTIAPATIAKEMAADPESARSEWGAEFRSDISALFDDAVIEGAVDHARPLELPPRGGRKYFAFADASAGRHDAFTFCVGHCEGIPGRPVRRYSLRPQRHCSRRPKREQKLSQAQKLGHKRLKRSAITTADFWVGAP